MFNAMQCHSPVFLVILFAEFLADSYKSLLYEIIILLFTKCFADSNTSQLQNVQNSQGSASGEDDDGDGWDEDEDVDGWDHGLMVMVWLILKMVMGGDFDDTIFIKVVISIESRQ